MGIIPSHLASKEVRMRRNTKWCAMTAAAVLLLAAVACSVGGGGETPTATETSPPTVVRWRMWWCKPAK
jgi:hypothetical protein